MSNKRRNSSSPECDSPPQRLHHQAAPVTSTYDEIYDGPDEVDADERPQVNPNTGQTAAFPGLTGVDEVFYGPANDGIDYIRMVRSEAKGIPQLLRAQPEDHVTAERYYKEEQDDGGYWDDEGTYTAKPNVHNDFSAPSFPKAQAQYYDTLLTQFALVKATMRCIPPLLAIEKLTSTQPISFPAENKNARITWGNCLKNQDPNPVQIACMDEVSVFELVRLITTKMRGLFQDNQADTAKRIGAWIWAVLGKCPDRGELGSEEISDLRQLAQKVVDVGNWLQRKSQPTVASTESDEEDQEGNQTPANGGNALKIEIEEAKRRLAAKPEDSSQLEKCRQNGPRKASGTLPECQAAKKEQLIVLDMVLTVVGEVYGQRDLLDLRTAWSIEE